MPLSIYVHIPFCTVRCAYCDFNTYAGLDGLIPAYVTAVQREIDQVARNLARGGHSLAPLGSEEVHTVFFGGGTPSLLSPEYITAILATVRNAFPLTDDCEVTLEANPGTLERQDLHRLRRAGVNRLSLGAQSAQPSELRLLDRAHSFADVAAAVRQARQAGFENLNLDLIFGLPLQTLSAWRDTLGRTLDLGPDHLSLYALSLEHGTPLRAWVERGLVPGPDPDLAAEMYEQAADRLAQAGLLQYEISNWAKDGRADGDREVPAFACRHNLQYWRNLPYLGIGAGAHGCALGWRYANVRGPKAYIDRIGEGTAEVGPWSPAVVERVRLDDSAAMDETMLLGFRLTREGIRPGRFRDRFGQEVEARYGPALRGLEGDGLIERLPDRLRLTRRGRLLGNRVFQAFV